MLAMWSLHVRELLNRSPRCLCVRTCGMGIPFMNTGGLCLALRPIERCLLFGALNSMPHLSAQVCADSRSALRLAQPEVIDLSTLCSVVSSAKIEHWLLVDFGRSLIKMRKRTGPRTVPWGIPDFGVCNADSPPSRWTHCFLCCK